MYSIRSVVKRHPLVTFFGLAYSISFVLYFLPSIVPGFPFLFPFGPIIAAIIAAGVGDGVSGLKELLSRCLHWRVRLRWYVVALVLPIVMGLTALALAILMGAPLPSAAQLGPWYGLLLMFPMAMIDAPLQENSGWHGYALPRFPASRSPLANTLLFGVLLAGWHAPLALAEPSITVPYLLTTVLSQVVTNWVFYNARQSALLAILYHSAANTVGIIISRTLAGSDLAHYFWFIMAVNAVVAVAVVVFDRKTWRSHEQASMASVEAVPGIS